MKQYKTAPLRELLRLIFPESCCSCGRELLGDERDLCTNCIIHLPTTNYSGIRNNDTELKIAGVFPFEAATSYLYYKQKNITQHIVHNIKYYGNEHLGRRIGLMMGTDLKESKRYDEIDIIVPVPLHRLRKWQRGYNQSMKIGEGIAEILGCDIDDTIVRRKKRTQTQTRKNRKERIENITGAFEVAAPEKIKGKHVLLVDDVLTTGATIAECAKALLTVEDIKISVATLAIAT